MHVIPRDRLMEDAQCKVSYAAQHKTTKYARFPHVRMLAIISSQRPSYSSSITTFELQGYFSAAHLGYSDFMDNPVAYGAGNPGSGCALQVGHIMFVAIQI